jgi:hypothetical protein
LQSSSVSWAELVYRISANTANKKCRGAGRGIVGIRRADQAFLRMNWPIIGQMISRQRRPEKMP